MSINPFKPTLGHTPPALVGRQEVLTDISLALDEGPGSHERITVITGPRGIGKTTLLNAIEDTAKISGWICFSETASKGFVQRLISSALRKHDELHPQAKHKITSIPIPGAGSLGIEDRDPVKTGTYLRPVLTQLLDDIDETNQRFGQDAGLMITLDELHHLQRDEIISFAATVQHLVREGRNLAVMMAGIPNSVKPLLEDDSGTNPITFLRRANRVSLGTVKSEEVRAGLELPIQEQGMKWAEDALNCAVDACEGYPFMIQLVGQFAFRESDGTTITLENAKCGIQKARRKLGQLVHEPALADLSDVDRTFLIQMARDETESAISVIAQRMNVSAQYAAQYRRRLIDAEMIEPTRRGYIKFTLPYLRDFLREHYASDMIKESGN